MKIRSQIILAQVPTVVLLLCIVLLFIFTLTSIEYQANSILVDNFKNINSVQKINESVEELNSYIGKNPQMNIERLKKIENEIEKEVIFLNKSSVVNNEEKLFVDSLTEHWASYKETISTFAPTEKTEIEYKKVKKATEDIIGFNQDALIRKKDNLSNFIIDSRLLIAISSVFSLIFGFFMFWIFTGLFLVPLKKMTEIVSRFGKTDKRVLLHIKGSEEIEKLSQEINLMTSRLEEYHQSSLGRALYDYENLKAAFDALPYPFLIFSYNNDISYMNKAALLLFNVIENKNESRPSVFYIKRSLKEAFLKIITQVKLTHQPHVPGNEEEPIPIFKQKKKNLFVPFAFPIEDNTEDPHLMHMRVVMILQNIKLLSAGEREIEEIFMTFIHDIQAPLAEIQLAIYTSLREEAGPLTEKQKDVLHAARDKSDELKNLYQFFLKISKRKRSAR